MLLKELAKFITYRHILPLSLKSSTREREERALVEVLEKAVPDLRYQYTNFELDISNPYFKHKVRGQHAFQMSLALQAFKLLSKKNKEINIVDIGDSAGTHLIYLMHLLQDTGFKINTLSVNLDSVAVEKIKSRGLHALRCRAEELHKHPDFNRAIDLFLSYEMLEHLLDPVSFLRQMAIKADCELFLVTVPYVKKSRVGMHHIRRSIPGNVYAEGVHIFELCPEDWIRLFQFSGWEVIYDDRYTQYPKKNLLNLTKYIWRRVDFDGFYGAILKKNLDTSNRYQDWPNLK